MTERLILRKADFFASASQPVAVEVRYPQSVFAQHTHDFCELVLVWRGNGLHVLNDRPWRITRGDLFYIRARDRHGYAAVNDLVLQNILYCPERLTFNVDWAALLPGLRDGPFQPNWRLSSQGMTMARQLITQLEQESNKREPLADCLCEALFLQLAIVLQRHRYAADSAVALPESGVLDALIAALANSRDKPFALEPFCLQHQCSERALRQQFRNQTGMTIGHYLRQLRICHAQYLLQHSDLLIGEVATRCGFEDSNYFSVVFTREAGMTPSQWRQHSGEPPQETAMPAADIAVR
ncbi:HTH-type transcriptional activator RhaR [Entomohabitans teleogrylli]|uniref:HTH-type transcriptional activator RhaR n=1 Tax=Entomohabitans teleogrylli TaxID=1384589 RepID=UPI00073D6E35|nr:HTH-type transcriptional activator RhaR [Entomohabitans teleogrylli]